MDGCQLKALADKLNDALAGQCVDRIDVPRNRWQANVLLMNCANQAVQRVHSRGKWLFFDFGHGVTWLCHLLTRAAWKIYPAPSAVPSRFGVPIRTERAEEPAAGPTSLLTISLRDGTRVTLTGRPLFQILPTPAVESYKELKTLGPDPLAAGFPREIFQYRLRQCASPLNKTVAAALLDQHVIAGLGNQLKCEILFTAGLSPDARVAQLFASEIDRITDLTLALCMRAYRHHAHLDRQARLNQVYDRAGEACMICGSEIAVDKFGTDTKWTWYCPTCQEAHREPTLFEP